ncbi:MAG: hypothetical protein ACLFTK_03860 [Anaerolineales bacterium]
MGIQLDWQIEADQTHQRNQEDPSQRRRRRRNRLRLILIALTIALVLAGVGVAIILRLQAVSGRVENDLRAVVNAELVALRIGDETAYMNMHRTTNQPWLERQRAYFQDYQSLKESGRVLPDSEVVTVAIDDQRARVVVQQTVDSIPQQQVWFYWQYEDLVEADDEQGGWRRVPPDVEFWGDEATLENDVSRVIFNELDADLARALAPRLDAWWSDGCAWLGCAAPPPDLEVIIDPRAGIPLAWEPEDGWRLRVLSPYLSGRVPVSQDVPSGIERDLSRAIAERLIAYASEGRIRYAPADENVVNFDMEWVYDALREWLIGQYRQQPAPFMDSIVQTFGPEAVTRIASTPLSSRQIDALGPLLVPGASGLLALDRGALSAIDWTPFFQWRLRLERQRLQNEDLDGFFTLYETGNFNEAANARAFDGAYRTSPPETLTNVAFSTRADGTLVALVEAADLNSNIVQISFVWNGDTFLRVN